MRSGRGDLLAVVVLTGLALGCFARLAARPGSLLVDAERPSVDRAQHDDFRPPGNDLTFVYLPHHLHVADEIARHGRLPHWDTRGFAGRPMVGNPQGGLFYPPVWVAWWTASPAALGWLTVAHLLWAALGTYGLLRSLGTASAAAAVAAGCVLASPYILAHVSEGHYPHVWAASWYPWAILAYRAWRGGRVAGALALAPILALALLAGHPQEWYYLAFVLGVWATADALAAGRRGRYRHAFATLGTWTLVVALSLGFSAVELAPDIAAQAWGLRGSREGVAKISHYQLHFANLFQLLSPTALGGPADYFGHDNYWETVLSTGLVPLVLAAVAAAWHPDRRLIRGWLILVAGAVVFAAGPRLGLFSLLFQIAPGMNRFRVPARSLFLASLGAAVLAGLGVETLRSRAFVADDWRRLARRLAGAGIAVATVLLVLRAFAWSDAPTPVRRPGQPLTLRETRTVLRIEGDGPAREVLAARRVLASPTFALALCGAAIVVALGRRYPGRGAAWACSLGVLALAELGLYGHAILRVAPASAFLGPDPISAAIASAPSPTPGPFRIRARDALFHDLRAWSNGFEKINVNDSFQIQHAADLYEPLYALLYAPERPRADEVMGQATACYRQEVRQALLDRLGVAYLISDHVEPEPGWPLVAEGRFGRSAFAVHRNPAAMPRAYVVPRAEPAPDRMPRIVSRMRHVDPREAVLMERDPLGAAGIRQPFTPAQWCSNDPDRVDLRVTTRAPGLLVVADTWMPGWSARVDGRRAPVLRGNHGQRVVPIEGAGDHRIVLRYEAPGLARGLAATGASAVVWLALTVFVSRRRARSGPAPHAVRAPIRPSRGASAATIRASGAP